MNKCETFHLFQNTLEYLLTNGWQPGQTNLYTTKDFRDFGIGSLTLNISATLDGVKNTLIFKCLQ